MQFTIALLICAVVGFSFANPLHAFTKKAKDLVVSMLVSPDVLKEKGGETIPKLAESLKLTEYTKYITEAGVSEELEATGPFTAFAPTNEVFEGLDDYLKKLLENRTALEHIMKYSAVKGKVMVSEIKNDYMMPTLAGEEDMMRFNVYRDGKVMTASGRVMKMPGKEASNGMLYEVMMGLPQPPVPQIAKSLAECPSYKILTKAIRAAGLEETLMGEGPFTMFAPTDEAFQKIPEETLDALMKNVTALKMTLLYHVVKGTFYTAAWEGEETVQTECGKTVKIEKEDGKFTVNGVPMSIVDTTARNGVVHVVDSVLMPPTAHMEFVFSR